MDVTGHNVWMGLAGMYIVDDPADPQTLPSGAFDVPLMIADRAFDANNQLTYVFDQNGVQGDQIVVNGVIQPYFEVADRKYRLRILNASNFSDIDLELSNGQPMIQVGTESGLLPAPVSRQRILLGPAERADIIVDFAGQFGQNIVLLNHAGEQSTSQIMQFRVITHAVDNSSVPATLRPLPALGTPVATRTFVFGHTDGHWTINGLRYDPNRVDAYPVLGTTERWILRNDTGEWNHVIHIHLTNHQIIARNGLPPEPYEAMKESWYLDVGDTIEILIKFSDYTGLYVFHCHLLEHEDDSMMGQFQVVAAALTSTPTQTTTNTPTDTITLTRTYTPTNLPTGAPTNTPTGTPTQSLTRTNTATFTRTSTPSPTCPPGTPTTAAVSIVNFAFNPQTVTTNQGSTVRWTNTANRNHTSTSNAGIWSTTIGAGQSFSFTFNTVGTFAYHCNIHPNMTGSVVVRASICATATLAPTNTSTNTPLFASTATSTPAFTSTNSPTLTPNPANSATITVTNTATGTSTDTFTPTPIPTSTTTPISTSTITITRTNTPTGTPLAIATATSSQPSPTVEMSFTDVHPEDYFYEAVRHLYHAGIITGYSENTFRPFNSTTRGQLCKIVVLARGWDIDTGGAPHFSDVPQSYVFYPFVETAYNRGVIRGYADGTFRPTNGITRGQFCKIITLAMGWTLICPQFNHFSDVTPSDAFYCFVETAFSHAVIRGYSDDTFHPGDSSTRGQICAIVYRAIAPMPYPSYTPLVATPPSTPPSATRTPTPYYTFKPQ
jgi:plastocyanin